MSKHTFLEKYPQPPMIEQSHRQRLITEQQQEQQEQTKIIDVFGHKTEPICNYHTCHHKFSLHGLGTRVYVSAIIHKIILQEYQYYCHHKLTTNE
jgi:hypothetical protein